MAIHNDCPGLTAEIVVDGKALPEYEDTDMEGGPHEMIRYVEAKPGSKFCIRWFFDKTFTPQHDMSIRVHVDGCFIRDTIVTQRRLQSKTKEAPGVTQYLQKREGDRWFKQELRINALEITDDNDISTTKDSVESIRKIGDITVKVYSGRVGGRKSASKHGTRAAHDGTSKISEELLKGSAKSLRASFGGDESIVVPRYSHWTTSTEVPTYVFTFKYRTKADLQALHILPRSPNPTSAIRAGSVQTLPQERETSAVIEPQARPNDHPDHLSTSAATPDVAIANSLLKEEIIAMIAVYRGRADGLAGQSKRSLLGLLNFYEDKDNETTSVKSLPATERNDNVRVKRERGDGASASGTRKRSKPETIVIDD